MTYELYEAYFPPRRHEFELQVLSDLIDAVAATKTTAFVAGAAAGGIIGNASYELLKKSLAYIVRKFVSAKRTHDAFEEVEMTLDEIRSYFDKRDNVPADKLYSDLERDPRKVEPLLKLLGFRSHRKKKRRVWSKPAGWDRNA